MFIKSILCTLYLSGIRLDLYRIFVKYQKLCLSTFVNFHMKDCSLLGMLHFCLYNYIFIDIIVFYSHLNSKAQDTKLPEKENIRIIFLKNLNVRQNFMKIY